MNRIRILLAGALAIALGACGGSTKTPDEFASATPDVAGLTLETSGSNEAASSALVAEPALAPSQDRVASAVTTPCPPYMYLCNIHAAVVGLNAYVRAAVAPIEALALTTPTVVNANTRVFGPVDAPLAPATPVATFKLTVVKNLGWFYWKLEGKPLGADDTAYIAVAGGAIRRVAGDLVHRGRGFLGIDLDKLYALNPASGTPVWNGEGQIFVGFGHLGPAKSVIYAVKNFSPDRTQKPPVPAAVLVGWKNAAGVARVRIADLNDWIPPQGGGAGAGNELLLSRAIWIPGLGGRAAVAIGGDDVGTYGYEFFLGISCYNATENEVFRRLFGCNTGTCTQVDVPGYPQFNTGTADLCALGSDLGVDDAHPPVNPQTGLTDPTLEPNGPVVTPDDPPANMGQAVTF